MTGPVFPVTRAPTRTGMGLPLTQADPPTEEQHRNVGVAAAATASATATTSATTAASTEVVGAATFQEELPLLRK